MLHHRDWSIWNAKFEGELHTDQLAFRIPNAPISMMEHLEDEKCMNISNPSISESIGPHNPQLFALARIKSQTC
jgi:hypothetical protein